ncbi:hypothetical protein [Agrobacterium sp. MS2]|uniref:hypothetical protein n=1 Tax=Agrobacterium sp. MS2 TaxID=1345498 RepID=UPI00256F209A|nr:hypothetical protein [Agrobacterium sp. MS2]
MATAQQELSDTVEDANAAFAAALAAASQSIADLQETLDQMLAGGVPAANVAITAIDGLTATNSQAAFAELVADLEALANSLTDALNLKADASALAAVAAGLGSVVTANTQAVAGGEYYAKTAGGAVTVTLPLTPADGNIITIWRYGANAVTIARNGKTINFVADDIQIDTDRIFVQLKYFDGNWSAIPGKF